MADFCKSYFPYLAVFALIWMPENLFAASNGAASGSDELNAIFLGLGFLAGVSLTIIGILAYLWHRHSKYKKQKVILDI